MRALVASLALVALVQPAFASVGPAIGVNAGIRNVVKTKTVDEGSLHPAALRQAVHIGDEVESGPNSALQVLLRDESVFTVGANARMTIDRFVYDPSRNTGAVATSVARGAFRFMSGKALHNNPGAIAIKTPVASIGVRGTMVEVIVGPDAVSLADGEPALAKQMLGKADPNSASLIVLRGPGPKRIGLDKIGAIDVTAAGHMVQVTHQGLVIVPGPHQAPLGPFPLPASISNALDQSLRTAPSTDEQRASAAKLLGKMEDANSSDSDSKFASDMSKIVTAPGIDPTALQDALAAFAAELDADSSRYTTVEAISHLLASSSGAPASGTLAEALGSEQGIGLASSYPDGTDFNTAVNALGGQTGSTSGVGGSNFGGFPGLGGLGGLGDLGAIGADGGGTVFAGGVPEPSTWMSMLAGFALVGGAARRPRRLAERRQGA